ncbi:MAG: hypothetical protein QOF02_2112 [Blastocatellia bacterium]|nr:hypothetical protein [Blastocatellia bacterium]
MQEAKDPESTETANSDSSTEAREPDSTATSNDTLNDVEQSEQVNVPSGSDLTGGPSNPPSPDGQFDGDNDHGGGVDPGPM